MANETSTGAPLTATVGERLEEKLHEGATPGVERAAAAVKDLEGAGHGPERQPAEGRGEPRRDEGEARQAPPRERTAGGRQRARPDERRSTGAGARGARIGWAVAAGVGTWLVAGMVGRAFRH